jgi:transcriptional regulator with XRE-family HTH domain
MVLLRRLIGDVLRRHRLRQSRTLRDVSAAAQVSLGYLSEVERGRKEASSELLAAICAALGVSLADVLREVSSDLTAFERRAVAGALSTARPEPVRVGLAARSLPDVRVSASGPDRVAPVPVASHLPAHVVAAA